MTEQQQSLDAIHDIKKMMERSSRFISLSGLSGVSAGVCALIGAWLAHPYVYGYKNLFIDINQPYTYDATVYLNTGLFWIAMGTFVAALLSAFVIAVGICFYLYKKQKRRHSYLGKNCPPINDKCVDSGCGWRHIPVEYDAVRHFWIGSSRLFIVLWIGIN